MLDETVSNSIRAVNKMLYDRQHNVSQHNVVERIEKAKTAMEGETRTRKDGSKWVKRGGKWVPLIESKTPPTSIKNRENASKKRSPKSKDSGKYIMPSHVSSHHLGTLRHIKSLVSKKEYLKAHDLASTLPDNVKHEIPAKIWHKMVEASHKEEINSSEGNMNGVKEKNKTKNEKVY